MVHPSCSYVVRFYAVGDELRARITDANASRSWTVADGAAARALATSLARDDPDAASRAAAEERP
jgi:hypothetical protein